MNHLNEEIAKLESLRGRLPGRKSGWVMGDSAYSYGVDMVRDLIPNKTYFHSLVLSVTGRMPEDRFCKWLEALFMGLSWPDPRIWCNTMGSLGATARASSLASTMAGLVASESTLYGPTIGENGIPFIRDCLREYKQGASIESIVEKRIRRGDRLAPLPGYARPIAQGDIRVPEMVDFSRKLGYEIGEHLELGFKLSDYLDEKFSQSINFGGYASAFFADTEYSIDEIVRMTAIMVASGVTACYTEDLQSPPNYFLPLRCDDIEYTGPSSRVLPQEYKNR